MKYRNDRYGNPISILGYGCMRFTFKNGKPDVDKAEKEVMHAVEQGVNYFDTAYAYPQNEVTVGEIFARHPGVREKIHIATKLPHYLIKKPEDSERIFQEELKRLQTTYVDNYLIHMLTDVDEWERMCGLGLKEWLADKKASGQVKQVGFSYHGNSDTFIQLLDVYDWDFCQIQYNYLDETSQAGVAGLKAAAAKGIPVVIMEPLRGGKLTDLPKDALQAINHHEPAKSPAKWAFQWLWNQPEVTCVLSGMNSMEMLDENLKSADESDVGCLTEADQELLKKVVGILNIKMKVGCTGCRYCMPCPKNVDIPGTFAAYNLRYSEGWYHAMKSYAMCTMLRKNQTVLTNCVGCGACEKKCPQHIEIRKELKNAGKVLENPIMKIFKVGAKWFVKY